MKILALESSAKAASAAVYEDGHLLSQYYQASALTHSRTLLIMTEDLLKNTALTINDIDAFAVAKGPGSFTGIRIGMAAAKGLAWGAAKPLCGVSTLAAMSRLAPVDNCIIAPVMDARRSQVYNALFKWENGHPVRLCEDRAISLEQLRDDAEHADKPFYFIGDGAELCARNFSEFGLAFRLASEGMRLQNAWGVAAEAAENGTFVDPGDLEPNYLRLSQAERERLARLASEAEQQ